MTRRKGVTKRVGNLEGSTKLHQACKKGDRDLVATLIEEGAEINRKDKAGDTPFHDAINHGEPIPVSALVKMLIFSQLKRVIKARIYLFIIYVHS